MERVRSLACLCTFMLCLAGGAVQAQPSVDETRQQLTALLESPPQGIQEGTWTSIAYLLDVSERIHRRYPEASSQWARRAARFLESAQNGRDPYHHGAGQILNRGYSPSFTPTRQGYAIYLPRDYDPERTYPLCVMLHGGSSNGNLFLAVVLGRNLDWSTYSEHLYDDFRPRWFPDWIVVAPDGMGQPIWRWMGEQDVLEVIDDVQRNYNIDADRIVLGGLSNGGMGAYSIGTRHAWRFSLVHAMAGAPSWLQYAGGRPTATERTAMQRYSAMELLENTSNTDFRYYHGTRDPGPMRPRFIRAFSARVATLELPARERWYEHGHDLLYLVHRHGRVYPDFAQVHRNRRPTRVRIVTGDYRANRQHWLRVTRIEDYPQLARADAQVESHTLTLRTDNVLSLSIDMHTLPLDNTDALVVMADEQEVYRGERQAVGHPLTVHRSGGAWHLGALPAHTGLEKRPGLSGPLTDAYHDDILHVYGTQNAENQRTLRRTAQRAARGWPTGLWNLRQRVVADRDVTPEMLQQTHVALYGSPGDNLILDRIASQLPIQVEDQSIRLGSERFEGHGLGARFIYPNPLAPEHYVLVHTGVDARAVRATRNLPDFVGDYVIYNRRTTARRPRLIAGRNRALASGYFDRFWRIPPQPEGGDPQPAENTHATPPTRPLPDGVTAEEMRALAIAIGAPEDFILPPAVLTQDPPSSLPPGEVLPSPRRPRRFAAPRDDPNGRIARRIARMVPTFYNYRAIIPGGRWRRSRRARFQIRPEAECLTALNTMNVPYERVAEEMRSPIPTPVRIIGPVQGVAFTSVRDTHDFVVSCELATRLPLLAEAATEVGMNQIEILSSHRTRPRQSFHRMGMALDIFGFQGPEGRLSVEDHFRETPDHQTCRDPRPRNWRARALRSIACRLARSGRFNSILTPNYNEGHRNHFHIDIRPNDPRVFLR